MMNVAEVGEVVSKMQARRWGMNDEWLGLMGKSIDNGVEGRDARVGVCSKMVMSQRLGL
jgi:hypothetical protein